MGLLALYLWTLPETLRICGRLGRWMHVAVASVLIAIHALLAPALLPQHITSKDAWHLALPADADLTNRVILVLNGPSAFVAAHFPLERDAAGLSVPRAVYAIGPSLAALDVQRLDTRTLRLSSPSGWLTSPLDRLARSQVRPMSAGTEVALDVGLIDVEAVSPDGRPLSITLHLRSPLEDRSLMWMAFQDGAYAPWAPPGVGAHVSLPAPALQ
jgi:hypothetical protein